VSVEVANAERSLGQFASNAGYSALIAAADDYPNLKMWFTVGVTEEVDSCVQELAKLATEVNDNDVAETAHTLASLIVDEKVAVITDGVVSDEVLKTVGQNLIDRLNTLEDRVNSVLDKVKKYNPCHEPGTGRFCSTKGGASGGETIPKTTVSGRFSKKERGVLVDYRMGHASMINESLYKGESLPKILENEANILDNMISRSKLENDAVLYRGVTVLAKDWVRPASPDGYITRRKIKAPPDPFAGAEKKVITSPAFTSTSSSKSVGLRFAKEEPLAAFSRPGTKPPVYNKYLLKISAPKGSHALDVNKASGGHSIGALTHGESEFLLGRGTKMFIRSIKKGPEGVNIVDAQLL